MTWLGAVVETANAHGSVLVLIVGLQQQLASRHPLLRIRPRIAAPNSRLALMPAWQGIQAACICWQSNLRQCADSGSMLW